MGGGARLVTRWGAFVARRRWFVIAAWLLLIGGMGYFSLGTARLLSPSGFTSDTEAQRAADVLERQFPGRRIAELFVVFHSDDTTIGDEGYARQVAAWRADLVQLTVGTNVIIPQPDVSADGRTVLLTIQSARSPDHFIDTARRAKAISHRGPAQAYVGGPAAVFATFIDDSEADLRASERESIPIALILLLIVFGGLVAAGLPLVTGLATVTTSIALLGFAARLHTVSVFSLNVSSVVGLGLGIDYSLLVVNRFREELRRGATVEEAVATTTGTAGLATVISGGTAMVGFGALLLSRLNVLWSIGLGGALVVAVSVVASLTLIPALVAVFGRHVDSLTLPFIHGRDTTRLWHGLARTVMARPFVFIAIVLAIVAVLALPARSIYPGVVGSESLPPADAAYTAQRLAEDNLGLSPHSPILVVATNVRDNGEATAIEANLRTVAADQRVVGPSDVPVQELPLFVNLPYAVYEVDQSAADNDAATHRFLDRVRQVHWPGGAHVVLGGEAAAYQDFLALLAQDFPKVFGAVIGLTFVLLAVAFRSLVLPLKAVVMNLLSVGAAMGILTFVFQQGHFSSFLDFRPVGFVEATVPIIIFAGLFGLSMDYEVFLLSRVREEFLRLRDNRAAVAAGMEKTGQIITSAAGIMVVVVLTLAFSQLTFNKAIGLTFAVAVFLDATLIRLLLVPAMMRVLGNVNWWPGVRGAELGRPDFRRSAAGREGLPG